MDNHWLDENDNTYTYTRLKSGATQKLRTGKLLKDRQDLQDLHKKTINEFGSKKQPQYIISKHPYDVAGMSTDKSWRSCMTMVNDDGSEGGCNRRFLEDDVREGTHIAYMVHQNSVIPHKELERKSVIGRIALKPYTNETGHTILVPESKGYGGTTDDFHSAVTSFLNDHFELQPNSVYRKHKKVYDDDRAQPIFGPVSITSTELEPENFKINLHNPRFVDHVIEHHESLLNNDHINDMVYHAPSILTTTSNRSILNRLNNKHKHFLIKGLHKLNSLQDMSKEFVDSLSESHINDIFNKSILGNKLHLDPIAHRLTDHHLSIFAHSPKLLDQVNYSTQDTILSKFNSHHITKYVDNTLYNKFDIAHKYYNKNMETIPEYYDYAFGDNRNYNQHHKNKINDFIDTITKHKNGDINEENLAVHPDINVQKYLASYGKNEEALHLLSNSPHHEVLNKLIDNLNISHHTLDKITNNPHVLSSTRQKARSSLFHYHREYFKNKYGY